MGILTDSGVTCQDLVELSSQIRAIPGMERHLARRSSKPKPSIKPFRYRLQDEWARWIADQPWQWYVTLTFASDDPNAFTTKAETKHCEFAQRCYRRWIRVLNERRFGKRFRKKGLGISHVQAIELQKRGVAHFHALLDGVEPLEYKLAHEEWPHGIAWIRPYDAEKGGAGYLSKYVSKGGELDMWLAPQMRLHAPKNASS